MIQQDRSSSSPPLRATAASSGRTATAPAGASRSGCNAAASEAGRTRGRRWSEPWRSSGATADGQKNHPRRLRGRVPRATRGPAGDAREAALPAQPRSTSVRRLLPRRARPGRDLGLADDGYTRVPLRGHPGAPPGARQSGCMAAARRQPRQAGGREPAATAHRNRNWKPAQTAVGIEPFRRIYDLRHTFATFALRACISTFELSRYMGASLTMIDRHYGHLARDGREHAIRLLDTLNAEVVDVRGRPVDVETRESRPSRQRKQALSRR
jgi:hypothetical protein